MEQQFKECRVRWYDANHRIGWYKADDIEAIINEPMGITESVGWLVHHGDDKVILAQSVDGVAAADLLVIPMDIVQDIFVHEDNGITSLTVNKPINGDLVNSQLSQSTNAPILKAL